MVVGHRHWDRVIDYIVPLNYSASEAKSLSVFYSLAHDNVILHFYINVQALTLK